jgi:hypothetical protein
MRHDSPSGIEQGLRRGSCHGLTFNESVESNLMAGGISWYRGDEELRDERGDDWED